MGRTSARMGNRRHPLFSHAKELLIAALEAAAHNDAAALASMFDAKMDTLSADECEDVIGMAYLELRQRKNSDEAIQMLVVTARDVSERFQRESDGRSMHLFGVVFQLTGDAGAISKPSTQQLDAVVQCMVHHRLLDIDASAELLPLLLSPAQGQSLLAGDVHQLSRALGNSDIDAAVRVVQQRANRSQGRLRSEDEAMRHEFVLLVGLAGSLQGTTFPLSAELAGQAQIATSGLQPIGCGYMTKDLLADMHRQLGAFSSDIETALGGSAVLAVQPPIAFAQASMHSLHLERSERALETLERIAKEHGNGLIELLEVGRPEPGEEGFSVPVHRKVGGRAVAFFRWPVARYEPPRDALVHLLGFIQNQGMAAAQESPPRDGPLH